MPDWTVAELAEAFKSGRLSRRQFIGRMLSVGLTAPVIAGVLAACGSSSNSNNTSAATPSGGATAQAGATGSGTAAAKDTFQPTKRGGGGTLKVLWWQGPTLLNYHLSTGTKDNDGSRIFHEPLAAWSPDAGIFPVLAAEIPSVDKGTVDKDGRTVTWKLKQGVQWHDGQPFTADDVVFTWQYVVDPTTAATSSGNYTLVDRVEKVDQFTVRVVFKEPTPFWQTAFIGGPGAILPKHLLEPFKGKESRNSPYNLKPVGTGPYKIVEFRPGDSIIAEINPNYHVPNRPFFDRFELKGGGDAPSAARAVLQTGDYDYGWNMQVEWDQLATLEKNGIGRIVIVPPTGAEHMQLNPTDPNLDVDGEKSSIKSKHPFFSDPKVRQAFALMINRKVIVEQLYGKIGVPGIYPVPNPKQFVPDGKFDFNLQKAGQMLDELCWKKGSDGVRAKDGKKMKVVYQTSINDVRQNTQAIIKKDLESNGIQVELKSVNSNVFFGDSTNPDSYPHFYADMQEYDTGPGGPDPHKFMGNWATSLTGGTNDNIAQKSNNWSGANVTRYQNSEYDQLWRQSRTELDPVKRADLIKKMQQTVIDDAIIIPIVNRTGAAAAKNALQGMDNSPWDSTMWKLPYWYRKA